MDWNGCEAADLEETNPYHAVDDERALPWNFDHVEASLVNCPWCDVTIAVGARDEGGFYAMTLEAAMAAHDGPRTHDPEAVEQKACYFNSLDDW